MEHLVVNIVLLFLGESALRFHRQNALFPNYSVGVLASGVREVANNLVSMTEQTEQ